MTTETDTFERILPLLENTKANAMKRVGAASDAAYCARRIGDWLAAQPARTVDQMIWYHLRDVMCGPTITDRHLATVDFITSRVPGGADADVRAMSIERRREIFYAIAREAGMHLARYRDDFKRATV